jgi:hypothetical protein
MHIRPPWPGTEGELTDDQVEKLTVGDRIELGALTGTIVQAGALFVAIQWDEKDLPELYTRAAMGQASLYMGRGLQ